MSGNWSELGIGFATAALLAARGAHVVIASRNLVKAERSREALRKRDKGASIDVLAADLSSQAEVRALAEQFRKKHDRLDVLLHVAGVLLTDRRVTPDGLETTFAVNHLAPFLLTQLLMEVLAKSAPARVVVVSSDAHKRHGLRFDDLQGENRYSGWAAYCRSKLANVMFTYELARRLDGADVTANSVHPGVVATGLGRNARGPLGWLYKLGRPVFLSPDEGARPLVYLASEPGLQHVTGKYFARSKPVRSRGDSNDREQALRLWEVSEELTKIRDTS